MTLLFVTQKLHEQDAFTILWVRAFIAAGYTVKVICLEDRISTTVEFEVHSLGKEHAATKWRQIENYWKLIRTLEYDRVFIHMSPVWGMLGAPHFIRKKIPTFLWYTHYKMSFSLRVTGWYVKRMFAATSQSLPQYEGSQKKIVTGHGIDLNMWPKRDNTAADPAKLLAVHRLSRSKRLELGIRSLLYLPKEYTLTVYGIEAEKDYVIELKRLTAELGLANRVTFNGTVAMKELAAIYSSHRLIINMASETIDKSMLEAMTCGCFPVTTMRNAEAIGMKWAPKDETPEAIADFILKFPGVTVDEMYDIVSSRHSLESLIQKMDQYIKRGI